jgi:peptidoglycan hydrolase-like protein with peptidoglycan-binding domain
MKQVYICTILTAVLLASVNTASASSCVGLSTNLRIGMKSNEVTLLQNYLNTEGYNIGQATGFFGQRTLAAVKLFQIDTGLINSGFVGALTRNAIQKKSCSTDNNPASPIIACTMEARLCADGSIMPRSNTTCEWFPNKCPQLQNSRAVPPSASYWNSWDTTRAKSLTDVTKAAIEAALKQVGVTGMTFETTTRTEAEILEQTKKFEQVYILQK